MCVCVYVYKNKWNMKYNYKTSSTHALVDRKCTLQNTQILNCVIKNDALIEFAAMTQKRKLS